MIRLGISHAELTALVNQLSVSRREYTTVTVTDLADNDMADLSDLVADGQVNVDTTQAIDRSAQVTFNDPDRSLPFDTDSPASTALFFDRMLHITRSILVGETWQHVPLFKGPVTGLTRSGDQVTATAVGKEVFFQGVAWAARTLRKGTPKTDAITEILTVGNSFYAEHFRSIPDLSAKLGSTVSIARDSNLWSKARAIASSMSMQLYYDGMGVCRLRDYPGTSVFTFKDALVVTRPQIEYSSDIVNAAYVVGGVPKGASTPVAALAIAEASHPLSPHRIGRVLLPNGQITTNTALLTVAEAEKYADTLVRDGLLQSVKVAFESIPVPLLEPYDLCEVQTPDLGSVLFRLNQYTYPLGFSGNMTVGYTGPRSLVPRTMLLTRGYPAHYPPKKTRRHK